jgi:hypothetical protein
MAFFSSALAPELSSMPEQITLILMLGNIFSMISKILIKIKTPIYYAIISEAGNNNDLLLNSCSSF